MSDALYNCLSHWGVIKRGQTKNETMPVAFNERPAALPTEHLQLPVWEPRDSNRV
jgi:hypothetical protein